MSVDLTPSVLQPTLRSLVIVRAGVAILRADADVSQNHQSDARVSDYPRENLADGSDHVQPTPDQYRATLAFTDTPIGQTVDENRRTDVYRALRALQKDRALVTLVTDLLVYEQMALAQLGAPKRGSQGKVLLVDVLFKRLEIGTIQSTSVPASVLAALVRASGKGKDDTKDQTKDDDGATKAARKKTLAKAGVDGLTSLFSD